MLKKIISILLFTLFIILTKCEFIGWEFPFHNDNGFVDEEYPLCIINSDGTGLNFLREDGYGGASLYFISNDGSEIIISNRTYQDDYMYIVNSDGTERKKLFPGINPVFSSDGSKILFAGIKKFMYD